MHKPHRTLNQHYTPLNEPIPRDRRTSAEGEKWVCVHEHHTSANCACMVAPGCGAGNRGHPGNQMGCGARACGVWDRGVGVCEKWCAWWVARTCTSWRARRRRSSEQHEKALIARISPIGNQDFNSKWISMLLLLGTQSWIFPLFLFRFFCFIFPCEKLLETLFFSRHLKAGT